MTLITNPFAILCFIAICCGVTVCIVSLRRYREFKTVREWIATQGEIIESNVRFSTSGSSEGSLGTPRYDIHVRYKYAVDGKEYACRRRVLAGRSLIFRFRADAESEQRRKFAVGRSVKVYYNPHRPKSATLDTEVDNRVLLIFFLSGIAFSSFAGAAICGLFVNKGSLMASFSMPLLLLSLITFVAVIYMGIRTPGERLVGDIGD